MHLAKNAFFVYKELRNYQFGNFLLALLFTKMRIIAIGTLKQFWEKPEFADAEQHLRAWYAEAKKANWKNSNDIKKQYRNASIVGNNRVVFNIKGNKYRLIVAIDYNFHLVFIRFVGTHTEYDKIDAKTI